MTITVANTTLTNTFEFLVNRTTELADAMTTKVVTTDSNTTPGNAAITGAFSANVYNVGNSTSNTSISAPNTEQKSSGNYFLNANGSWSPSLIANNGLIANSSGTFVNANNGIIANSSGTFVNANTGIVVNTAGVFVNSNYIGTLTGSLNANNASNLGGVPAASYVQNTDSRTLSGNLVFSGNKLDFIGSNVNISGTLKGDITGNASTATKLLNARNINGVSFDGTTNITVADSTKLPLNGGTMTGQLNIQMAAPSIYMEDTNNSDFYIYVDGNIWNILNNGSSSVFNVSQSGAVVASSSISAGGSITATSGTINGGFIINGDFSIFSASPTIHLADTSASGDDFYIHVNGTIFQILNNSTQAVLTVNQSGGLSCGAINSGSITAGGAITGGDITAAGTITAPAGIINGTLTVQSPNPQISMIDTNQNDFYIQVNGDVWQILNNALTQVLYVTQAGAVVASSSITAGGTISTTGNITASGSITATSGTINGALLLQSANPFIQLIDTNGNDFYIKVDNNLFQILNDAGTSVLTVNQSGGLSCGAINSGGITAGGVISATGGTINGGFTINGGLAIQSSAPQIYMADTSASGDDFYMEVDGGLWRLYNNGRSTVFYVTQAGAVVADSTITAYGSITAGGSITATTAIIQSSSPTIHLADTDQLDFYIHVNSNIFYLLNNSYQGTGFYVNQGGDLGCSSISTGPINCGAISSGSINCGAISSSSIGTGTINGGNINSSGAITAAGAITATSGTINGAFTINNDLIIQNSTPTIIMNDTSGTGNFSILVNAALWTIRNNAGATVFSVDQSGTTSIPTLILNGGTLTGISSQAQAEAGSVNSVVMTPLRTIEAMAGRDFGAVGSYALLGAKPDGQYNPQSFSAGAVYSGSLLGRATLYDEGGNDYMGMTVGAAMSGSWRNMGGTTSGSRDRIIGIFLRVS